MNFDNSERDEFKSEAYDILDDVEQRLLHLRTHPEFSTQYDAVFRAFHNIKGAAGMLELRELQSHMHRVETEFARMKGFKTLVDEEVSYFLRAVDLARKIISTGHAESLGNFPARSTPPPVAAVEPRAASVAQPIMPSRQEALPLRLDLRALVIDDQKMMAEAIAFPLRERGFEVEEHQSARDALARLHEFAPHVVVSDLVMPEMNGAELLRAIRQRDVHLPVLFVSGALDKEVLLDGLEYGISGAFEKPFDTHKLLKSCMGVARRYQLIKLFNKSVNLLLYQFSDLDSFLMAQGKDEIRRFLQVEITDLLTRRREITDQFKNKVNPT